MTLFAGPPAVITRTAVPVMLLACADELPAIQALWTRFEDIVGMRGRRMYGVADVVHDTYSTCTPIRPGERPAALALEVGELAAGHYRRGRLVGDPPDLYARIGPGFDELEALGAVDRSRPLIEFYKRHDQVELWLPVLDDQRATPKLPTA